MSVDISKINNALVLIGGIVLLIIVILLFFVALYRKPHNFFLQEKELMEIRHTQILMESQLELQENIFTQISREIHDNIGQLLSLVRLNINTINLKNVEEKLAFTDELLDRAITDLRSLSHSLNTSYILEAGLVPAISRLLESLQKTGQFSVTFNAEEIDLDLENEKTIILFRIIQEIINNIVKHAAARKVEFTIKKESAITFIEVKDDGRGFDTSVLANPRTGIGISNMFQRAKLVPANIQVSSTLEIGTTFTIAF